MLGVRVTKAAESSKATAKAENALALENAAKRNEVETDSEQKAEAADVSSTEQGPLAQKRSKKKVGGRQHLEKSLCTVPRIESR